MAGQASDLSSLTAKGFQVEFHSHSKAILTVDFPEALSELEQALLELTIPIEEIIAGGGGETKGTQRLRRALSSRKWLKHKFEIKKMINNREREAISHEIDHVRAFPGGIVALEIEWNNKDPFFDRDLENFKRLHVDGAISVGIIVTRGRSLHENMRGAPASGGNRCSRSVDSRRWLDCPNSPSHREFPVQTIRYKARGCTIR
jgi:Restriction endonuclease BglII